MARASQEITRQELAVYDAWVKENNIQNTDANALVIATYMLDTWGVEFTRANLDLALPQLRASLTFYTPLEAEYLKISRRMTPEQVQTVSTFISRRGLKDDGDNQLQNFITVASWILDKSQPITTDSLDRAIGNIINGSRRPLLWKTRLQDSEKAAQAQREAASQQPARQDQRAEATGENSLAPHLREHRRQMHAALAEAEARKIAENSRKIDQQAWKARAESLVADSHLDNIQIKKLFVFVEHTTDIDWVATHRARLNFIERRRNQKGLAGR